MNLDKLTGPLELELSNNAKHLLIPKLYSFNEEGELITAELIIDKIEQLGLESEVDRKIIDFWLNKMDNEEILFEKITIADYKLPKQKDSQFLEYAFDYEITPDNHAAWNIIDFCLKNFKPGDYINIPYKAKLFDEGEPIAQIKYYTENEPGKDLLGNEILPETHTKKVFKEGNGVIFNKEEETFYAGTSGFLVIKDNTISIREPFFVSTDQMALYFINLNRVEKQFIKIVNFHKYLKRRNIPTTYLVKNEEEINKNSDVGHILLVKGKKPTKSYDAELLSIKEISQKIGEINEIGNIDYKEINKFESVERNEIIARKKLAVHGEDGHNIFGTVIPHKRPKDIPLKAGPNTRKEIQDGKILEIKSSISGVLEIQNNIVSVFPVIRIYGNVNYETGNIRTEAHVEISGDIKSGFKVISDKSIIVKGNIENYCYVEAKGDLYVQEGVLGENTIVKCGGNFESKFIENAILTIDGNMKIRRFIMGAKVQCRKSILIKGEAINLDERGALVDSEIKVRNKLITPVLGSQAGLKNFIYFAYDENLLDRLINLKITIEKLKNRRVAIINRFNFDILGKDIRARVSKMNSDEASEVIDALKNLKKLKEKKKIMQSIYKREEKAFKKLLENSSIKVSKKIIPPLILKVQNTQKIIEYEKFKREFYYNIDAERISERNILYEDDEIDS